MKTKVQLQNLPRLMHADNAALHEVSIPVDQGHLVSIIAPSDEDDGDPNFLEEDLSD